MSRHVHAMWNAWLSTSRAFATTLLIVAAGSPAAAGQNAAPQPPPSPGSSGDALVHALEIGTGLGGYDNGLGRTDDQFFRYRLSRVNDFNLALDVGRERRFGETSLGGGVSFTKSLPGGPSVSAGWSTGSGYLLGPRYRVDVGVTQVVGEVLTTVGYTRRQSKAANASDGVSIGAVRWFSHWIVGGNTRLDVGWPGRTISTSVGAGATWYQWKSLYIGGELNWGDVSYVLLPDTAAVGYRSLGGGISVSRWFNDRSGLNVRGNFGSTDLYRSGGLVMSVFREF